jgi:putative RecB family exonuclease
VSRFSHSRIESFETCPKKYEFAYVLKVPRGPDGIEAFMGSRVHDALEWLYGEVRACRVPSADDVAEAYARVWDAEWSDDVRITREGRCADDYRAIGEKAVRDYHARYAPFDQDVTVGLEARISLRLDGEHEITGFVDRIAKAGDGEWEIHDYKTSATLITQQKADADRQLALYEIAVREMYPEAERVALVWHFVVFDAEVRSARTPEQLEALRADVLAKVRHIEAQTVFPTATSNLCNWCEYKPICPAWSHLFATAALPAAERVLEEGSVLVDEYIEVSDELAALKERQDELKESIAARAAADGVERLFGTAGSIRISRHASVSLPGAKDAKRPALEAEVRSLGLWETFSTLSSSQLARAIQDGSVLADDVGRLEPYLVRSEVVTLYRSAKTE